MATSVIKKLPVIKDGVISGISVRANSYKDVEITYPGFARVPNLIACLESSSSSPTMGRITVSVVSVDRTTATVRIFNSDTSTRLPGIRWIAIA